MPDLTWFTAQFPYVGLFSLLILGGLGLPFPEDTTFMLCGFLLSHHAIRTVPALAAVYAGALTADVLIFFAGRKYGRRIVSLPRFSRILSPERLQAMEQRFRRHGVFYILMGRHLVGLRAQLFLAAGVVRMPVLKFVLADAISLTVSIAIMTAAGYLGGNSLQVIRKDMSRVEHVLIFLSVAALAIFLLIRFYRSGREKKLR